MRRRTIVWLMALVFTTGVHHVSAAQEKPAASGPTSEQQDMAALVQAVEAMTSGKATTPGVLTWTGNHFIRSQGDVVYIPFTISIDKRQIPGSSVAVYIRAVSRAVPAAPAQKFAWETMQFVDMPPDGRVSRAIALPSGTYDVYVSLKEKGNAVTPPKVGVISRELTVPSFATADLTTSSIILARSLEQLPAALSADKQQDNPYVFGPLKVTPSSDGTFSKSGDLQVLFWIYGASQTAGKPDVQIDFSFHQRLPDGEKYFNKTNPQELNAKTLPAEFNLTLGHQLLSSLSVPLGSFPPGDYRLEIKVTDRPSGKSLTNNVNFAVSAS